MGQWFGWGGGYSQYHFINFYLEDSRLVNTTKSKAALLSPIQKAEFRYAPRAWQNLGCQRNYVIGLIYNENLNGTNTLPKLETPLVHAAYYLKFLQKLPSEINLSPFNAFFYTSDENISNVIITENVGSTYWKSLGASICKALIVLHITCKACYPKVYFLKLGKSPAGCLSRKSL